MSGLIQKYVMTLREMVYDGRLQASNGSLRDVLKTQREVSTIYDAIRLIHKEVAIDINSDRVGGDISEDQPLVDLVGVIRVTCTLIFKELGYSFHMPKTVIKNSRHGSSLEYGDLVGTTFSMMLFNANEGNHKLSSLFVSDKKLPYSIKVMPWGDLETIETYHVSQSAEGNRVLLSTIMDDKDSIAFQLDNGYLKQGKLNLSMTSVNKLVIYLISAFDEYAGFEIVGNEKLIPKANPIGLR